MRWVDLRRRRRRHLGRRGGRRAHQGQGALHLPPEVIGDIGGFGGLFAFAKDRYRHPVLVSSTDGVGTKALVAQAAGRFDTIGVDLVAMCVDDLVCQGAEPLFFLDYIAVGRLDPDHIEQLVQGDGRGLPPGRLRADRRRDGRAPGRHGAGRVRPGRLRRRRRRARPPHHRRARRAGRRADRPAVARPAQQRLLAGPARCCSTTPAARSTTPPSRAPTTPWPTSCSSRR